MAVDAGMMGEDDEAHLAYATSLNAVVITRDHPFAGRTSQLSAHSGLICWNGKPNDYGGMIRALVQFCQQHTPEQVAGHVFWLK